MAKRLVALVEAAAGMVPGLRRLTPEQKEQKRRLAVNAKGRMGSAIVVDFREGLICYKYTVRGVQYQATQEVTALLEALPADPNLLIGGAAGLKYLPKNPANSIVVCETWSGLRKRRVEEPSDKTA